MNINNFSSSFFNYDNNEIALMTRFESDRVCIDTLNIIALDHSGSMCGDGIRYAKEALKKLLNKLVLNNQKKIYFIPFESRVQVFDFSNKSLHEINNEVNKIKAMGGNDFITTVKEINNIIQIDSKNINIIFLTDGGDTWGKRLEKQVQLLKNNLELFKHKCAVHAIGFTEYHDVKFLMKLVNSGNIEGTFQYAQDGNAILGIVESLSKLLLQKSINSTLLYSKQKTNITFKENPSNIYKNVTFFPKNILDNELKIEFSDENEKLLLPLNPTIVEENDNDRIELTIEKTIQYVIKQSSEFCNQSNTSDNLYLKNVENTLTKYDDKLKSLHDLIQNNPEYTDKFTYVKQLMKELHDTTKKLRYGELTNHNLAMLNSRAYADRVNNDSNNNDSDDNGLLNSKYFKILSTYEDYSIIKPLDNPMILFSKEDFIPLASLHFKCKDDTVKTLITKRPYKSDFNCDFQGIINKEDQEFEFIISNLTDSHINFNIMKMNNGKITACGLNEINSLKPYESCVVDCDQEDNCALILNSILENNNTDEKLTVKTDENNVDTPTGTVGTYYYLSVVPEKKIDELFKETIWGCVDSFCIKKIQQPISLDLSSDIDLSDIDLSDLDLSSDSEFLNINHNRPDPSCTKGYIRFNGPNNSWGLPNNDIDLDLDTFLIDAENDIQSLQKPKDSLKQKEQYYFTYKSAEEKQKEYLRKRNEFRAYMDGRTHDFASLNHPLNQSSIRYNEESPSLKPRLSQTKSGDEYISFGSEADEFKVNGDIDCNDFVITTEGHIGIGIAKKKTDEQEIIKSCGEVGIGFNSKKEEWSKVNPKGKGSLEFKNFLEAGYHLGVNTQTNSLRNANLQFRSEPINPQVPVSIWDNKNKNRKPLEIRVEESMSDYSFMDSNDSDEDEVIIPSPETLLRQNPSIKKNVVEFLMKNMPDEGGIKIVPNGGDSEFLVVRDGNGDDLTLGIDMYDDKDLIIQDSLAGKVSSGRKMEVNSTNAYREYNYDVQSEPCVIGLSISDKIVFKNQVNYDEEKMIEVGKEYVDGIFAKTRELLTELSKIYKSAECVICLEEETEINSVFYQCGHSCSHYKCGEKLKKCPLCRKEITAHIKL